MKTAVKFSQTETTELIVNRNKEDYRLNTPEYDVQNVIFLIDLLLLNNNPESPDENILTSWGNVGKAVIKSKHGK